MLLSKSLKTHNRSEMTVLKLNDNKARWSDLHLARLQRVLITVPRFPKHVSRWQ